MGALRIAAALGEGWSQQIASPQLLQRSASRLADTTSGFAWELREMAIIRDELHVECEMVRADFWSWLLRLLLPGKPCLLLSPSQAVTMSGSRGGVLFSSFPTAQALPVLQGSFLLRDQPMVGWAHRVRILHGLLHLLDWDCTTLGGNGRAESYRDQL